MLTESKGKILLIDRDDSRRETRIRVLVSMGYKADTRRDFVAAERLSNEGTYDLVIIALYDQPALTITYSDELTRSKPSLPILLLTDRGVFVPPGTLSFQLEAGSPLSLIKEVAKMLAGSTHIREIPLVELPSQQDAGSVH